MYERNRKNIYLYHEDVLKLFITIIVVEGISYLKKDDDEKFTEETEKNYPHRNCIDPNKKHNFHTVSLSLVVRRMKFVRTLNLTLSRPSVTAFLFVKLWKTVD